MRSSVFPFLVAVNPLCFAEQTLEEEGAAIIAYKLVTDGVFQEAGIVDLLSRPGSLPNNYGARKISDNLSDLKAQVAANHKGAVLMNELVISVASFSLHYRD